MNYFIVKVVVASSQQVKCSIRLLHDFTTFVMSQWVGNIIWATT